MEDTITNTGTTQLSTENSCPDLRKRQEDIKAFIHRCGLANCRKIRIAGDASHRRYQRIFKDNNSVMLMDSPPDKEPVSDYINVAAILHDRGFSVPHILEQDREKGFLLLEDFGNTLFSKFFHQAALEDVDLVQRQLYNEALNILIGLAQQGLEPPFSANDVPLYTETLLEKEVMAFSDWFLPEIFSGAQLKEAQHSWKILWQFLIGSADLTPQVLVHRDYHVDNLCWLDEREGLKRVGLLDFQDAVRGRRAYDVVSLLEDARRDVPFTMQAALKQNYIKALELNEADFNRDYAFYGAQRNAKILGYFVKFYRQDGKPRYLAMIERVWNYFLADIEHPALDDVRRWIQKYFDSDAMHRVSHIVKAPLEESEDNEHNG